MTARRFRWAAWAAAVLAVAVVVVASSGVLPADVSETLSDVAQLVGAVFAAACFAVTGSRARGLERRWRLLVAAGMTSWGTGQAVWTTYRATGTAIPSPSLADVGYLGLFVFMLPALLVVAAEHSGAGQTHPDKVESSRSRAVLVLDGLVVVGSLLTLAWSTALGAAVRAGAPSPVAFAVAVAYPITDLVLVVILLLLATVQRVRWRPSLLALGLGLIALAVSDSFFTWLVSNGAEQIHPLFDIGFVAAPVLITLAALAPAPDPDAGRLHRSGISASAHLLIPYLPLVTVGLVVVVKTVAGADSDRLQTYVGILVVGLVVIRQLVTLRENLALLQQVREAQRQLAHQAFHDPLTGLANRLLFGDRLTRAVAAHQRGGHPVALLFCDLDDFKTVNDTFGHAAGDQLLREFGRRLDSCVRATDTVARFGGDEFAVLLEGDLDLTDFVVRRVLPTIRQPFTHDGTSHAVRTSIGMAIATGASPDSTCEALLHQADTAMYEVKRQGGSHVGFYTPRGVRLLTADASYATA